MWWAGLCGEPRSILSGRTVTCPPWERSWVNREQARTPGFWEPFKVQGCDKPQCPPHKEHQREGGELAGSGQEVEKPLSNQHTFRTWALSPSWCSWWDPVQSQTGQYQDSKALEKEKSQLDCNEAQHSRQRASPEQTVNLNPRLHWDIIISIFIYVYLYICYIQKNEISGTIKPYSPRYKCNCSSTLGTVLGYTCRIIGKTQMESLNTGI